MRQRIECFTRSEKGSIACRIAALWTSECDAFGYEL